MGVSDSKQARGRTGAALHILTSALTYTTHLHALSDAESEEVRALLGTNVNLSSTTTSGDTPQASTPVVTTHTAPTYLHALSGADDGEVGALMGININISSITNSGDNPHASTVYQSYRH